MGNDLGNGRRELVRSPKFGVIYLQPIDGLIDKRIYARLNDAVGQGLTFFLGYFLPVIRINTRFFIKKSIAMNKLFIGLLIIAAGTGIFFLLSDTKGTSTREPINKELIIGKWKEDGRDPGILYVFEKDLMLLQSLGDSMKIDSSYYTWKQDSIIWKETLTDSMGKAFVVQKLTKDTMQLQATDSKIILLVKQK